MLKVNDNGRIVDICRDSNVCVGINFFRYKTGEDMNVNSLNRLCVGKKICFGKKMM